MKLDQTIQQHVEKIPLTLQGEVLDFVIYLEQKSGIQPALDTERRKPLAIALEKACLLYTSPSPRD